MALLAALVGLGASVVATLASHFGAAGTTPAWAYSRFGGLTTLTTFQRIAGIPIEVFGCLAFIVLVVATIASVRRRHPVADAVWFLGSVALASLAALLLATRGFYIHTAVVALIASLVVFFLAATSALPTPRMLLAALRESTARLIANRAAVSAVLLSIASAALMLVYFRATSRVVSPRQANIANFLNWYESSERIYDKRLRSQGVVTVAAFIDYQCPFCATRMPQVERVVRRMTESSGTTFVLATYDFPLDSSCNAAYWQSVHPAACDAATAVRLTRAAGSAIGNGFSAWLYGNRGQFTRLSIENRLTELGLQEEFRHRRAELSRLVTADAAFGRKVGVRATPTFFVDGARTPSQFLEETLLFEAERQAGKGTLK